MTEQLPILYSFRRCPYAIRARLGLLFAGLQVELREVVLKDKPPQMLAISPKATVPVLQLPNARVIDESLDILLWAIRQNDPDGVLDSEHYSQAKDLLNQNDTEFKYWLDRYKYFERYPAMTQTQYRQRGEAFLQTLEQLLDKNTYLLGASPSTADIGIMPFVRQFAHVDRDVFYRLPYPCVQQWLKGWLEHPVFVQSMKKYQPWQDGDTPVIFPAQ
ncbi:glutathione S-transferase [Gilvimarinus sp. DA14]|uniref:glutathione S-transferase n=1 Tax=Gilvimarinus sp. DA14 TaxID=2956798 RepID=UPI0020B775F2|nr:glutathione S-transferase [Gilvimarinus sp. DA14]UTF60288.1 glutathione S-transferase [Gilvimarinus sp. DA14]